MAKKSKATTLGTLASRFSEAKRIIAPLTKKMEEISELISETEWVLGSYQEIADGVIVRKARAARKKTTRKARKAAAKKRGSGLSSQLKAYRKKAGLNQEALAKKLGVNVASVRAWEQGRSNPRKAALKKIEGLLAGKAIKPKKARKVRKTRKVRKQRKVAKATPKAAKATPAAAEAPQA